MYRTHNLASSRNSRSSKRHDSMIHIYTLSRIAQIPSPQPPYLQLHLQQADYPPKSIGAHISATRPPIRDLSISFSCPFSPLSNVLSSVFPACVVPSTQKSRFCTQTRFAGEISKRLTAAPKAPALIRIYSRFFGMNLDRKSQLLSALPGPLATSDDRACCNHAPTDPPFVRCLIHLQTKQTIHQKFTHKS